MGRVGRHALWGPASWTALIAPGCTTPAASAGADHGIVNVVQPRLFTIVGRLR